MDGSTSCMHRASIDVEHHHKAPHHLLGIMVALFPMTETDLLFLYASLDDPGGNDSKPSKAALVLKYVVNAENGKQANNSKTARHWSSKHQSTHIPRNSESLIQGSSSIGCDH